MLVGSAALLTSGVTIGLAPLSAQAAGTISLTALGTPYTQNFDTLAASGTSSSVPTGWEFAESGTNANAIYTAGTGSGNAGDTYSFGLTSATDRAFGGLRSGSLVPLIGASFTNNTGALVTDLVVRYTGEQWRLGQNTTGRAADRLDFQLSTNATSLTAGTWTDYDGLDFSSPVVAGSIGALNGNSSPNRTVLALTITGLSIPDGSAFWIRLADSDLIPGSDDALSIDDFSITPADPAPLVVATTPANGATDVVLTSNVTVTFSEPVNIGSGAFDLSCAGSSAHPVAVSGGPIEFTLDPGTDFANSEPCTLTVDAALVSDQDAGDPFDTMAADYVTSFTTIGPDNAPAVASTLPADGATDVALTQNVVVNFSEPVDVTDPWFTLTCATSGSHPASVSGGPASFTLDPTADFVYGETCALVIDGTKVSDRDSNDPPDTMVVNFTVGFATTPDPCTLASTSISAIQGSGLSAAITGNVTTQGIVVGDYEGASPTLRGFYIQDGIGDGNPATSDGIFVFNGNNNTVSVGDVVRVTGTAVEFQDQTQISATRIVACGTGSVAPVDVTLPLASVTSAEAYEGMLVRLPQTLYVTEHFQLGRFGQVVMSSGGRLPQPTNVVAPGAPAQALQAANNLNRIIVDDALQNQNPDPILFGRNGQPLSASNTLRGGDTATGTVGVMTYTWAGNAASGNAYRVRPINALGGTVNFVGVNQRPDTAPEVGGTVQVVGMNLLNFFNTFDGLPDVVDNCKNGLGGAATDCRGADTQAEFDRQWPKTVAAIVAMDPDVVGVNEIENDGYGPDSSLQFLVDKLNEATAPGTYGFINVDANTGQTNAMGLDAIRVAQIYKLGVVTPVGQTAALNTVAFVNGGDSAARNRASLAQAYEVNGTGAVFVVNTNHLKSKGSACNTPDAGDGQGNCNQVRVNAVTELANWLAGDPTGTGDADVLLVGDYNSYAMEDPIIALQGFGFTNLVSTMLGPDAYSYVFDGQWGYLDQALASSSLLDQISGIGDYHINSDEPSVLDYNTDFKTANLITTLYAPNQFRVSDHDPVVIGLTPNAPPVAQASFADAQIQCGAGNGQLVVTFTDPDSADTHTVTVDWGDGSAIESFADAMSPLQLAHTYSPVGHYTATVTVTDDHGYFDVASASTTVIFTTSGVRAPINADGSSVFKYRSTIPVKVAFADCDGSTPSTLAPTIVVSLLSGSTPVLSINEPVSTSAADTAGVMRFSDGTYVYNLATRPLPDSSGTYRVTITVPFTGQTVTAVFGLRP